MNHADTSTFAAVLAAAEKVRAFLPAGAQPQVALVLGSGLGDYATQLVDARHVDYGEIGFPQSRVHGHAGRLYYGRVRTPSGAPGVEVLAMQGRVHCYEGHSLQTVVLPVRALIMAGCKTVVLTNAAGGVGAGLEAGDLVLLRDHLNLMGDSPLRGHNDDRLGPRFPDMTEVYDAKLRAIAEQVAAKLSIRLKSGVYAGLLGPQYETPAEIRMLRTLGADAVGMSTVPEAIQARALGMEVAGISMLTNWAAGLRAQTLHHAEVVEVGKTAGMYLARLLKAAV